MPSCLQWILGQVFTVEQNKGPMLQSLKEALQRDPLHLSGNHSTVVQGMLQRFRNKKALKVIGIDTAPSYR